MFPTIYVLLGIEYLCGLQSDIQGVKPYSQLLALH